MILRLMWIGLAGALIGIGCYALAFTNPALLVCVAIGGAATVLGVALTGSDGLIGQIGAWTAIAGRILFGAGALIRVAVQPIGELLLGIADPLTGIGLIILGVAVIRDRRWTGPVKFLPIVTGLFVFVILLPAFAVNHGRPPYAVIAVWMAVWAVLTLALRGRKDQRRDDSAVI